MLCPKTTLQSISDPRPNLNKGGGGGGGWMDLHLSTVFGMLQYFETIFPSVEGLYFDILYKLRYISWVVSLLGACDITNNGRHL